ncbi:WXG100 family type VII secretion target [Kitasatospora sp. NPDC101176]|uniref:WXG100 family type VII secretion target n=1 Tax=Kitasatospora sp. NPDC101176 TaxID=3364099 RepID=UPI0037F11F19
MAYTDFTKYSHAQLRTMAEALDPGAVMAAGDPWRRAADTLKAIRATLTRASTEAAVTWEGATSDAFHTRMLHLADGINNAASYGNDAANTLHAMSEAIAKAKRDMPEEPSTWEQAKNTLGDGISSVFGGDDEHLPLADRRKTEAATVMQTLAMHYRIATPALKPPQPVRGPNDPVRYEDRDAPPGGDPGGQAAAAAMMVGAIATGERTVASAAPVNAVRPRTAVAQCVAPHPGTPRTIAPSDPGIKGGSPQAEPKRLAFTGPVGSGGGFGTHSGAGPGTGTGIDAVRAGTASHSGSATFHHVVPGAPEAGSGAPSGQGLGAPGRASGSGWATPAKAVMGGEDDRAVPGRRGGRAPGSGGVVEGRPGGVVGGGREGARDGGRQAFTEGGSGLAARARTRGEAVSGAPGALGPVMGGVAGPRGRSDKENGGKRPDYLVEDPETWAAAKPANPNVVE